MIFVFMGKFVITLKLHGWLYILATRLHAVMIMFEKKVLKVVKLQILHVPYIQTIKRQEWAVVELAICVFTMLQVGCYIRRV